MVDAVYKVYSLGNDISRMVESSDVDSSAFWLVVLLLKMMLMSEIHSDSLSFGRYIRNLRVSMSQPRTILASSGVPSPFSFLVLVASAHGIGSSTCVGRNMVYMASGAAFFPLITNFLCLT